MNTLPSDARDRSCRDADVAAALWEWGRRERVPAESRRKVAARAAVASIGRGSNDAELAELRAKLRASEAKVFALSARVAELEAMRDSPDLVSWLGTLVLGWDRLAAHLKWAAQ